MCSLVSDFEQLPHQSTQLQLAITAVSAVSKVWQYLLDDDDDDDDDVKEEGGVKPRKGCPIKAKAYKGLLDLRGYVLGIPPLSGGVSNVC